MPENDRQVKAICISVPEEIIEHVGQVLDRPVMHRERIQEEMMAKRFEEQDRAANERIVAGKKTVVPDQLSRECRETNGQTEQSQTSVADPATLEDCQRFSQTRFLRN